MPFVVAHLYSGSISVDTNVLRSRVAGRVRHKIPVVLAGPKSGRADIGSRNHHWGSSLLYTTHSTWDTMVTNIRSPSTSPHKKVLYVTILHTIEGRSWVGPRWRGLKVKGVERQAQIVGPSALSCWAPSSYSAWDKISNQKGSVRSLIHNKMIADNL